MFIYLIRHGEQSSPLCNVNVNLSEKGVKQANLLGERLKNYNIDLICSSNLIRAVETANIVNQYLNVELRQYEELREISFGEMESKSDEFIEKNYKDFFKEFESLKSDLSYPNGECGKDVANRTLPIIMDIAKSGYENVAMVVHGGVIRAVICEVLGLDHKRRPLLSKSIENTGITALYFDKTKDRFCLHSFNDHAHLEADKTLLRNKLSR